MMNPTANITLTDAALEHIQALLSKNPQGIGFRLSIKKTGCSGYAYVPTIIEQINANDIHVEAQRGLQVYLDSGAMDLLNGIIIDYVADQTLGINQKRLVYVNPQEKNRCGCGESFTI